MEKGLETGMIKDNYSRISSLAIDTHGKRLFYGTYHSSIKVYDLKKETIVNHLKGHFDRVWALEITKDGSYLVSGGNDGVVFIWDIKNHYKKVQKINFEKKIICLSLGYLNRNL